MNGLRCGLKTSDSFEDLKIYRDLSRTKNAVTENANLENNFEYASVVKCLDESFKVMKEELAESDLNEGTKEKSVKKKKRRKKRIVTTPPVDPMMQNETEEGISKADSKEDSTSKVSKKKKKKRKKKTILSESTPKATTFGADAEKAKTDFVESLQESLLTSGAEVLLKFIEEEATEKKLCLEVKEMRENVEELLFKSMQKEAKEIAAWLLVEVSKSKGECLFLNEIMRSGSLIQLKLKSQMEGVEDEELFVDLEEVRGNAVDNFLSNVTQTEKKEFEFAAVSILEKIKISKEESTPNESEKREKRKFQENELMFKESTSDAIDEYPTGKELLQNSELEIPLEYAREEMVLDAHTEEISDISDIDMSTPFKFTPEEKEQPGSSEEECKYDDGRDVSLTTLPDQFDLDITLTLMQISSRFYSHRLLNLYTEVIDDLMRTYNLEESDIQSAIENLNYNYRNVFKGETPFEIDFNDMTNCVGYLHRFAPCHAVLVKEKVAKALSSSPEVLGKLRSKRELNVVSLGGGPGNDLVGLLSYFSECLKSQRCYLTVMDKMSGWASVFTHTIHKLKELYRRLEVNTTFIKTDLTKFKTWGKDMKEKLRKADVILMVKVLSNIPEAYQLQTLQNVMHYMKPGALLFLIDCPLPPETLFYIKPPLECIYNTEVKEFDFECKIERFGCNNITKCRAAVYFIEMRNPNKTEHVPDRDDVREWPTLA